MMKWILTIIIVLFSISTLYAADDPSLSKGEKEKSQKAMQTYIQGLSGTRGFPIFDPQAKAIVHLKFKELHSGVVKKENYLISCADFEDPSGIKYDIDFIVRESPSGGTYEVVESLVHKKNGVPSPYDIQH